MAAKSGKHGYVVVGGSTINELTGWDYEHGSEVQSYASRAGGGATQTEAGVESGSGTINCLMDPDDPASALLTSGTLAYLYLHHNTTVMHEGYARIGKRNFSVSRAGELQPCTIQFTQHGEWQHPGE